MEKHKIFFRIFIICIFFSLGFTPMFAGNPAEEDFTIIVLPDTQKYCQYFLDGFKCMTEWIVANRDELNIVYVAHVGDVVENASNRDEWEWAEDALAVLEDPLTTGLEHGIPYGMAAGNHDVPTGPDNPLFNIARFSGRDYYGGFYDVYNNNSYAYFSAGGMNFIVLHLSFAYNPDPAAVLDWANDRLDAHPIIKLLWLITPLYTAEQMHPLHQKDAPSMKP